MEYSHVILLKYLAPEFRTCKLSIFRGTFTVNKRNRPKLRTHFLDIILVASLVLLIKPSDGTSESTGNDSSGNPLIVEYRGFLKTLELTDRKSVLVARDEFSKRFEKAPGETAAEGFRVFRNFYRNVVDKCDRKYFWKDLIFKGAYFRKEYQDALNEIMSYNHNRDRIERVTDELMNRDPIEVMNEKGSDFISAIKEKYDGAVDELLDFRKCGIGFSWGEGDWYLKEDQQFLADTAATVGGGLAEYMMFSAEESKQRLAQDAALLITWEQLREKIIRYERFSKDHPDLSETKSEIEPDLYRFMSFYLNGIENTHAYDRTGKIDPDLRASYERLLKENVESSYYPIIQGVYEILKRNEFTYNDELAGFIKKNKYDYPALHDYFYKSMVEKKKSQKNP